MRRVYALFFFILMGLLAFWKPIFHSEFTLLSGGDICAQTFPWFNVASHWLKKGVLLLWDPYVYAGKATLGELQPGLLYPLNWLFMLLPEANGGINSTGLEYLVILNYVLAAFFCYLLARSLGMGAWGSLISGVAFSIGGYSVQLVAWINIFGGFIWMPLIFSLFRNSLEANDQSRARKLLLWSALLLSLSFLAGHHAPPIHTALLLFFYTCHTLVVQRHQVAWRRKARWIFALLALPLIAALLTAVQSLPSSEWARMVWRWVGEGDPVRWGQTIPYTVLEKTGNLNPQDVVSLVLPYVSLGANIYIGAPLLFLVLIGFLFARSQEARFFGIAAFIYFFLSCGQFSALHGWLNTFLPGLWFAREVYLYLIPFQLCLAILAGFGLDHLVGTYSGEPDPIFGAFMRRAGWGMAILVILSGVIGFSAHVFANLPWNHVYLSRCFALAAYLGLLGALLFFLHTKQMRVRTFGWWVVLIVLIDLSSQFSMIIRTVDQTRDKPNPAVASYWRVPPEAAFLKDLRKREVFRVDNPEQVFPPNFGDAWLIEETMGHGATARVDYLDFRGIGWGPASNPSALLNARYFVSRNPVPGMSKVFEAGSAIYRNPRAVPRVFIASRYLSKADDKEVLSWVQSPLFSPRGTVILKNQDLGRLPHPFLSLVRLENQGILVRPISYTTTAERQAEKTKDEEMRHRLNVFHAPWGWSAGDDITMALEPQKATAHCFLIVSYYPAAGSQPTELILKLKSDGRESDILCPLPGFAQGVTEDIAPLESAVDLGPLAAKEYQLSCIKPESCTAQIDSLRVSLDQPDLEELNPGTATLSLFEPNRMKIQAELKRPSFLVVSELFYPGWEAWIDGRRAPLLQGDYILRTIPVSEGRHEIVLRFRSKTFQWGLIVSLVTLSVVALLIFAWRRS